MQAFDRVVTDDVDHAIGSHGLHFGKPIDTDLAGIMSGKDATPQSSAERVAFVFAGTGLADVVLASLVFGRAVERGIGRILPL